jgi:alkylation response protein AidB-like acyl-CoA dehydrogenase/electron transfer flavoprotein alpha/beta subunit/ferredoxin-like protein FixX
MRKAGDALGVSRGMGGALFRAAPSLLWNCVAGWFPRRPREDAAFEPIFFADPDPLRRPAPWSVRWLRARFSGALADALFHLYRNDPVPVARKVAAARDAVLGRLSLLDLVAAPLLLVFNYALGHLHRLGFAAWVGLKKPRLDEILATPAFRLKDEGRRITDLAACKERVAHDDKLATITYRGDERTHIRFHVGRDAKTGLPDVASSVFHVCPARVYREERDLSLAPSIAVLHENCVKCETCWRADPERVDWGRTRTQRLVFESYTPADAWLRESLEAAALAELARTRGDGPRENDAAPPPVVALDDARRATAAALIERVRRAARGFRPLHDGLPPVLFGADQALLGDVVDDAFSALETLDAELRPVADTGLWARLDALAAFRALAAPRRAAKRFFDLEADFDLLATLHLPDLERRTGCGPAPVAAPTPTSADAARAKKRLRDALAVKLPKEAVAEAERAGAPVGAALEALKSALRELLRASGDAPPAPGSAPRDLLLEELARLSPSLALSAHLHLVALDLASRPGVAGDAEDLRELRVALRRVTPLCAFVDGSFAEDGGQYRGAAVGAVAGAPLFVVPAAGGFAVFGATDAGVSVEAPPALGFVGAGTARLVLDGAEPRAVFGGVDVEAYVGTFSSRDALAIARGMTDYAAERALDHAESRVQFPGLFRDVRGRDGIAKFGAVQAMLAGIAVARATLDALRGASVHGRTAAALAADLLGPGPRSVLYLAGQALGGTAYSEEDPVCRLFRDAATFGRFPYDARAASRRHGRRQLKLVRGGAGKSGDVCVGLDLRPVTLAPEAADPADWRPRLDRVRAAWTDLNRALDTLDAAAAEAVACDLGRLALLTGGLEALLVAARAARRDGAPDALLEAAFDRAAARVATKAARLMRRLGDVPELVELGRLLLRDGVAEGRAHVTTGATTHYGEFLGRDDAFQSGDLVAKPGRAGRLCWTPELLEADPLLGKFHDETVATYRARWRDVPHEGRPYARHVERHHRVPVEDLRRLLAEGAFRRVIPEKLGGQGWKKAKYYVDCVAMMRHGDPAIPLIVMGSTSIGTTPILIGLEQDLPGAERAFADLAAHPERVQDVADRVARVRRMLDGTDALKAKAPFEELMGVAKKALGGDKALRFVFQAFNDALTDAARAGMKKDLAGFRAGLDRCRAALEGWRERVEAERATLPHRRAMHEFYLRQICAGRISAFALTEPSAGSDTARIRTKAERVEVEALADPLGFYVFVPAGGAEPRNVFPVERCTFEDGRLLFHAADGTTAPVETRDFKDAHEDGPAKFRYVELGGRRVEVHDFGRVAARDGKFFFPYFRVNGQKMWITNGSVAGVMSLYARTDRGPTGFMLDAHQEGLVVGKDEEKMGQRGSATNELALKDVRIPVDAVVGIEGRGQENALETLNVGRAGLAATAVGMMQEILVDVREALARGGREPSPADLLEMGKAAVDLVGSESLAYQLVGRFDHKGTKSIRVESALGKAETSEALHRVLVRAERVTGVATVLGDGMLEKRRRDARVLTIYEGTNEIQRFLTLKDLSDVLATDPPALEPAEVASPGVAAGLRALETARAETFRRVADVRARFGPKAWQDVSLQPWMFQLVESYAAAAVLSATVRRVALAVRLVEDDRGRPRVEYLERALKLMAKAAAELPQGRLADFDRDLARFDATGDLWTRTLADRALLAHAGRADAEPAALPATVARRVRALVVIDPAAGVAPHPRVVDGRLAETWCELAPHDRGALHAALALKAAGDVDVDVSVVGVGSPLAAAALEEALALGADRAHLVNVGRRALLAADVASFTADLVRLEEELHGPFDVVIGADRNAGLLLPLARRLDLDAVRGVADFGADVGEAGAAFPVRLERPETTLTVRGPVALLTTCEAEPHAFAATIDGMRRAKRIGVRAIAYEPREAPEGLLRTEVRRKSSGASDAVGGPLDVDAAAARLAEAAGLTGGAPSADAPFAGRIVDAGPEFLAESAATLVLAAAADGLPPTAASAAAATRALAGERRAAALVVAPTDDEETLRRLCGPLTAAGLDVAFVGDAAFAALPDARLGRALEALLKETRGSVVYAAELRGAALTAAEGRAAADEAQILVDGVDRLEACDGVFTYSGARLDGRARYGLTRPRSAPVQLVLRGEIALAHAPTPGSGRPVAVARLLAPDVGAAGDDALARALRAARTELGVPSLADAEFILDVGYGVGSRDGLEEVVEPMRAALERLGVKKVTIGASRKVTQDLGLLPDSAQIGQTGVSVDPRVMIALGVSGAPQHLNYIGERAVIFAFNTDAEAPLMALNRSRPKPKVHPVVGDLFVEAPKFLKALEKAVAAG